MTAEFSIAKRIRDLLDESELTEPVEIAQKLLANLSRDERAEAFEQVAETVVGLYITRDRMHATPAESTPAAGRPAQTRADRAREWWKSELRKRYRGATGTIFLGEFSIADHEYAAADRRERAAAILDNAQWHEMCVEAMRKAGVETFEELPAAVLGELFAARRHA